MSRFVLPSTSIVLSVIDPLPDTVEIPVPACNKILPPRASEDVPPARITTLPPDLPKLVFP
jgi:hypothetical protein